VKKERKGGEISIYQTKEIIKMNSTDSDEEDGMKGRLGSSKTDRYQKNIICDKMHKSLIG